MVLYSIYPPEVVLGQPESAGPNYMSVEMDGRSFLLEAADGQMRIVRLMSTDPRDYLNPDWQPGKAFSFGAHPQTFL